jgi:hypothetical protein
VGDRVAPVEIDRRAVLDSQLGLLAIEQLLGGGAQPDPHGSREASVVSIGRLGLSHVDAERDVFGWLLTNPLEDRRVARPLLADSGLRDEGRELAAPRVVPAFEEPRGADPGREEDRGSSRQHPRSPRFVALDDSQEKRSGGCDRRDREQHHVEIEAVAFSQGSARPPPRT